MNWRELLSTSGVPRRKRVYMGCMMDLNWFTVSSCQFQTDQFTHKAQSILQVKFAIKKVPLNKQWQRAVGVEHASESSNTKTTATSNRNPISNSHTVCVLKAYILQVELASQEKCSNHLLEGKQSQHGCGCLVASYICKHLAC